jgi:hypothetical protein
LNAIEMALIDFARPASSTLGGFDTERSSMFWTLQAVSGYNLADVLISHLYRLHLDLVREDQLYHDVTLGMDAGASLTEQDGQGLWLGEAQRQLLHYTVAEIGVSITILQGLTLCTAAAKRIMQRKSSVELLLQIVLADYCLRLLPPVVAPAAASAGESHADHQVSLSLPSGFALDLLMCVLVDNRLAQERFAEMGGLQQIVQLSHKCADSVTQPLRLAETPSSLQAHEFGSRTLAYKQTDLLCLEFRYFWVQLLRAEGSAGGRTPPGAGREGGMTSRAKSSHGGAGVPPACVTPKGVRAAGGSASGGRGVADAGETPKGTMVGPGGGEVTPLRRLRQSVSVAELRRAGADGPPPQRHTLGGEPGAGRRCGSPLKAPAGVTGVRRLRAAHADAENMDPFRSRASTDARALKTRRSLRSLVHTDPALAPSPSVPVLSTPNPFANTPPASARIPPSPAVRRAQLARARSLSPTKLAHSPLLPPPRPGIA